ncbi:transporter [Aquimarina sp. MMG016]|uniref:transporter n=1 Tax=Aquimarina sp. MMG016 TaxID=2822690 RepID=UPI001B39CE7C|nr:transporter [Aquimarina sp. MMG016]MBQ4820315.1 transporter [Aquimarina sp. MMG016]
MQIHRITLFTFLAFLGFYTVFSQEQSSLGVLITDRPDATESPTVMPKGYLQIETGAFFEDSGNNAFTEKTTTFNTTLLRYGLLDNLEFRVGWDFAEVRTEINRTEQDNIASGLSPLLLGAKVGITEEKGLLPEIGLLGHLYLPFSAGTDFRPETTGVDFRFSFAHTLSDKSSLAYNLGAEWGNDSPEAAYVYTLVYGYSITDNLGVYAELYGDLPEDNRANHLWDAGLTYLLSDSIQLDATVGSGITKGQNLLLAAGISIRLPN